MKPRIAKLSLALGATVLALFLAELACRATGWGSPVIADDLVVDWVPPNAFEAAPWTPPPSGLQRRDLGVVMRSDWSGSITWRRAADGALVLEQPVRTSSLGLRGAEHPPTPEPGVFRMLGVGDSVTFGQGVTDDETFLAVAESILGERHSVELINAGVPSWDLRQQLRWIEHRGLALEPQLLLVFFYVNDLVPISYPDPEHALPRLELEAPAWARGEAGLRRHSWLFNKLWRTIERGRLGATLLDGYEDEMQLIRARSTPDRVADSYRSLAKLCAQAQQPCGVAVLPTFVPPGSDDGADILDMAATAAASADLQVLRLDHAADGIDLADRFVLPGDLHPSARSHRAMGRELAAQLEPGLELWEAARR